MKLQNSIKTKFNVIYYCTQCIWHCKRYSVFNSSLLKLLTTKHIWTYSILQGNQKMVYFVQRLASLSVQCTQLIWMIFCKIQQHFVPKHLQCLFSATTQNKMFFCLNTCSIVSAVLLRYPFKTTSPLATYFFFIRFWYLRCCGCPWNRGRQHLATPLKTCQNIEAGFLTGWLLCLSPNSDVTASETPPFPHLGCVPVVVPAKGGSSA